MSNGVRTRSGRISKKPQRLELKEEVEDDYREDEYNSDVDLLQSDDEDFCTDDEEDDDEDYSDEEEEEEEEEEENE